MIARPIRWRAGDPGLLATLDRLLPEALTTGAVLHEGRRRRLIRLSLDTPGPTDVVVKQLRPTSGLRRLREAAKRTLRSGSAEREWASLTRLHALGLPVPEPLAWAQAPRGEAWLVTAALDGRPFATVLAEQPAADTALEDLARAVEALHEKGFVHGDLHLGNLWWSADGVRLLDVARSRRTQRPGDRAMDRARLEFSLGRHDPEAGLVERLRRLWPPHDDLDAAGVRFRRDHQRGRARRRLRPGRDWVACRTEDRRGLRDRRLSAADLDRALSAAAEPDSAPLSVRRDGRTRIHRVPGPDESDLIVKTSRPGTLGRALADAIRGCAAERAFRAGQRRRLLDDAGPRPLAWLAERRFGLPVRSWLVLEAVGDEDLDRHRPGSPEEALETARALGRWLARQHAAGLGHRDLKGGNLRLTCPRDRPDGRAIRSARFFLLDLEDLTGPAPIPEEARIEALAQLNASLGDEAFDGRARRAALARYAARLPFEEPLDRVAAEIARRSRARAHRWTGECRPATDRATDRSASGC